MTDRQWNELGRWAFWLLTVVPLLAWIFALPFVMVALAVVRAHGATVWLVSASKRFEAWYVERIPG